MTGEPRWADANPTAAAAGIHGRSARRDRRSHRLPRLPEGQLHHRRGLCRRRRPHAVWPRRPGGNGAGSRPPFRPAR